ncbi:O-antigen ligase family protein [Rhodopseudomonas pseudopalustris]|uniref:O-antigen ligase-related domain-containing protein n=1 Tax=Rhodopseudomonas pseudopalustris TaxID=1513892 RepID=A0A1H8UNS5_9BRAD|nr:O-antigen ligase family protein [Rhodopseudomonas pseudopalustris]SEP04865.1 hypothetical protein SAMN05444123_107165 [Rhodopseudomonas pseudopalustris]
MTTLSERLTITRRFFREKYPFAWVLAGFFVLLVFYGKSITQNYYYLLLLVPFLLAITAAEAKQLARNGVLIALAVYFATLWFSLLWNGHTTPAWTIYYARNLLAELSFVTLIAWLLEHDRNRTELLASLSLGGSLFIALVLSLWGQTEFVGGRLTLFMWSNSNTGAAVTGVATLLLVSALLNCRNGPLRYLIAVLLFGLSIEIVFSLSRATLLAVITACFVALLARRSLKALLLLTIPLPVVMAAATAAGFIQPLNYLTRGDSARFEVWRAFWQPISEHIWRGIGIDRQFALVFEIAGSPIDNPHNMFLIALLYAGIPACLAWAGVLFVMVKSAVPIAWRGGDVLALSMAVYVFVHGLVEGVLLVELANWQWIYLLLPIGCVATAAFRNEAAAASRSIEAKA